MKNNSLIFDAEEYDDKIQKILPYYSEFYKQVISVVKNCTSGTISWLDVGCGTGRMASSALKEFDINRFCFTDCSKGMLDVAMLRYSSSNTEFNVCDSVDINYDNEFDVVTAIQCNHYLHRAERIKVISNCYRALKTGGIFISFENTAARTDEGKDLYLKRWKNYQMSCGRDEEEVEAHLERYNKAYFPITIEEHIEAMEQGGFSIVEPLWYSYMQSGIIGIKE